MADPERDTLVDALAPPKQTDPESACLIVMHGDDLGRRIQLDPQREVVFGRDADCDVVLDEDTASRRHAAIAFANGHYTVRDLGSTNGVFINYLRTLAAPLSDGDVVRVGRSIFKLLHSGHVEASYHETIYELMTQDALTGANNRRHFDQQLARELCRAARYQRSLAVVLLDIDHFKRINDTHGHLAGDEVLRRLSAVVNARIRREDVFARVGGEEFALLLPEGTLAGAETLAGRLRGLIEAAEVRHDRATIRFTCSFGVAAMIPTRDTTANALLERADGALFAAKHAGRNCVRTG